MDGDNAEDVDGSIHSIHVRNFFCHENLEITLNRNVNFVVGRNGSGKSAILTALVVGLGARASATNRGNNLQSFIKKGANSATVEIKIKNSSPKAYKNNVYGDYITIVRNINSSGGSSYKVKSASGEVISTKYEEVSAIVLSHDIQVDNPISVLNQDDARSFHASDSKKKYALFRKATNLDLTETNYVKAIENCQKASAIWNRKHEASIELQKELKKWEASYEQLQSRDEIEAQKESLQNEYYWSEVAEFERESTNIQVQYDRQKIKINKLVEKLKAMEQNFGSNTDTIDALKAQLEEKQLERTALTQELQQLESELREVQSVHRQAQQARNKQNELRNRENKKITDLDREIQNIDAGDASRRRVELEARAAAAATAAEAAAARHSTAQHEAAQTQQHAARAATAHSQQRQRASAAKAALQQLKQQQRELQSRSEDSLAVYGRNMVELVQQVKQAAARGAFSATPKGPVGAYLKLKDKKWGGAIEHLLGGSLMSFCVNSPEDSRKLFEIMNKVYGTSSKPAVTCSKFLGKKHDSRQRAVRARSYQSALEALSIADPDIHNYVLDGHALETVLLVPAHEEAMHLTDNIENVPQKCSKVVTLDCTEYHPAPNYRCYGGSGRVAKLLHASTAERARQVQVEIEEAQSKLNELEAEAESSAQEATLAREQERQAAKALQALLSERASKEAAARSAQAALDSHQAPHHAVLVEELQVSKEKLQKLDALLEELTAKETGLRQKIDEYDEKMRIAKNRLSKVTLRSRSINEELDQEQLKLEQGVSERQSCSQKLKEDKSKLEQVEKILDEKRAIIEQKIQQALTLCDRVENPRDKTLVYNELKKTQMKLSSIRSDGLTKEQVSEKLIEVQRKYKMTKRMLDRLQSLIKEIQKTADKHLNFCHKVQTYIARRVQYCFQSILTLRGYSGRMDIDHAGCTLSLACSGRDQAGRRAASTASLSGGERSYSTVAFVMALWDCVELPFYFMDEFDVFMDNVNRKIVMELLIDHALKNTSRQFVFLTPQDASSVSAGPQLTIHRMADPRR